jgi:rhamnopyranosyl-N-acetylglucosaminyl-diphospho-decaprenol beta-1,3/1,4-galactofuranosyltransferase
MDDDGEPQEDCLSELLAAAKLENADFISPLIINLMGSLKLIDTDEGQKKISEVLKSAYGGKLQFNDILYDEGSPFNGILVSRELVNKIGYPKREMFIYGDEIEYILRAKKHKAKIVTIKKAIFKHPQFAGKFYKVVFNLWQVPFTGNRLKDFCIFRNRAYIYKKYWPHKLWIEFIRYLWFFLISMRFDFKNCIFFLVGFKDGLISNFSRHKNYL